MAFLIAPKYRARFVVKTLLCLTALMPLSAQILTEYQVKAAFLYNFVRFVEWPTTPETTDPINIGVVGQTALVNRFRRQLQGQTLNGRPIAVKAYSEDNPKQVWHVVFVPSSEEIEIPHVIDTLKKSPTITVGESPRFIPQGGMINFFSEDRKVKFEVNMPAVRRSGLKIDSQMLQYAQIIDSN